MVGGGRESERMGEKEKMGERENERGKKREGWRGYKYRVGERERENINREKDVIEGEKEMEKRL